MKQNRNLYTDDELISLLTSKAETLHKTPTQVDLNNDVALPRSVTYWRRFGSYNNALRLSGLKINTTRYPPNPTFVIEDCAVIERMEGHLLGDAHLCPRSQLSARFVLSCQFRQYLEYEYEQLPSGVLSSKEAAIQKGGCFHLVTLSTYQFRAWRDRWYDKDGHKRLPDDFKLTPLSLKMFYVDDGNLTTKSRQGRSVRFLLVWPSDDEFIGLQDSMRSLGIPCHIAPSLDKDRTHQRTTRKGCRIIRVNSKDVPTFFKVIGMCHHKCYAYKWINSRKEGCD